MQLVHKASLAEHGGAVVNVSSVSALAPLPGSACTGREGGADPADAAARVRAGALGAGERGGSGGGADEVAEALFVGHEEEVARSYPLKRLGVPEDIGSAVAFLLSDEASWITGRRWCWTAGSPSAARSADQPEGPAGASCWGAYRGEGATGYRAGCEYG